METNSNTKYETALSLYKKCLEWGGKQTKTLDPVNWIVNRTAMRTMWENYKKPMEGDKFMSYIMLNNPYSEYQMYMYDNY